MANQSDPNPSPTHHDETQLWISADWYIPVDSTTGQCIGRCAEGALGFIIQIRTVTNPNRRYALKVPRLMGETHRENAYICELLERELAAVEELGSEGANPVGLLTAQAFGGSVTRGPINTLTGSRSAQYWHGAILFVRFEKSQNPYFCLVKQTDKGIETLPKDINIPIDLTTYEELARAAYGEAPRQRGPREERPWQRAVLVYAGDRGSGRQSYRFVQSAVGASAAPLGDAVPDGGQNLKATVLSIPDAFTSDSIGKTWYTAIPSVIYAWAFGTLQESIGMGQRGVWTIKEHLDFIELMCRGLNHLHSKKMIHADIRPANIMYQGDDPKVPAFYVLTDYGSFAETRVGGLARLGEPDGGTAVGPIIGGERASVFYAPERKSGVEREAADTAVTIKVGLIGRMHLVLGWKQDLLDEDDKPKGELKKYAEPAFWQTSREDSETQYLQPGDRLQIREYIFELLRQERIEGKRQVFEVSDRFWKIYHGRIVVICEEDFPPPLFAFPIPRTIELQKWSAATDLYSLGVLALYTVYRSELAEESSSVQSADMPANTGITEEPNELRSSLDELRSPLEVASNNQIEDDFREMLAYLASPPYFDIIWLELDWLRHLLEQHLDDQTPLPEGGFAKIKVQRWDVAFPLQEGSNSPDEKQELRTMVVETTRLITQTVPGTRRLVAALKYDLGTFIFFIHFVLSCLHRETHMEKGTEEHLEKWKGMKPFCKSRLDDPERDGPTSRALARLEKIMGPERIGHQRLRALRSTADEIPKYNPKPDAALRVLLQQQEAKLAQTEATLAQAEETLAQTELERRKLQLSCENLTKTTQTAIELAHQIGNFGGKQLAQQIIEKLRAASPADYRET